MKIRAPRNQTITLADSERPFLRQQLASSADLQHCRLPLDRIVLGDVLSVVSSFPAASIDLMIVDPPYNLNKQFGDVRFARKSSADYKEWIRTWLGACVRLLKPTASVYICSDWSSSPAVHEVASEYLFVRNRITWEREKGRGALRNWKNCSEDILFCTLTDQYVFNIESVRLKRQVVAPYRQDGKAKGWQEDDNGRYRLTSPSNLWTDITVPFWSMPENTDHPAQKPEKLIAKLVLASSNANDVVLDPFLGSGTTAVVCKKLKRHFVGIEFDESYCLLAQKRLALAESSSKIQGYEGEVFLERNTLLLQRQELRRARQIGMSSS